MATLKVSGKTQIQKLAGAIAGNIRQEGSAQISLVGASALNQAIKACIVARRFLKDDDIAVQPEFIRQNFAEEASEEGREVTTIRLHINKVPFDPAHAVSSDVPSRKEEEPAEEAK